MVLKNTFKVHWQQSISLRVHIDVLEDLDEVNFGTCLRMLDGTFLIVVHNCDDGKPLWNLKKGKHEIEVTFENSVKPGTYVLSVGAYQKFRGLKNLFHIDAVNIEVLPNNTNDELGPIDVPALMTGVDSQYQHKQIG